MPASEIKIKGRRFVLIQKKEFDALTRRTAKKAAGASIKNAARNRRAIELLGQWESSPLSTSDAQWDALQADIAANRFRLRI
jgi:hypothetical protein